MAENDVTTRFTGDTKPLEDSILRLSREMKRFATIAEKAAGDFGAGLDKSRQVTVKAGVEQRRLNEAIQETRRLESQAKPQSARSTDRGFIGPQLPLNARDVQDINRAMAVSTREATETRRQIEARVKAELKSAAANKQTAQSLRQVKTEANGVAKKTKVAADNMSELSNPSLRFALFDIGNALGKISLALSAAGVAPVAFRIKLQREFADVVRTNQIAGDSSEKLRNQLLGDLKAVSQATPINWSEITDIATLAGQLGIATNFVAKFTESVAKFASVAQDLGVEEAATAFGRLNELIDGVDGQFDRLGSAILAVGIDSVSTEAQIVNVSQQIASMGNLAGLSAADIIGLSSAIASLGIRPELARGNITRLFSNINRAVATSGFALTEYGRLTGRTADEFADAWESRPTEVLLDFFEGLQREGSGAERTLRDIGITSVRDIPAFLRLAQNIELVRRQVALSNQEFEEGTLINEQFAIIAGTTAEQLRRLAQNGELLLASFGSLETPLSALVGILNGAVELITDFTENNFGQIILGTAGAITLALAGLAGFASVAAINLALIVGFRYVVKDLSIDFAQLTVKTLFSAKALDVMGLSAIRTSKTFHIVAKSAKLLSVSLGIVGALLVIGGAAYRKYQERQEALAAITERLFSDTTSLTQALEKDREEIKNGAEALRVINTASEEYKKSLEASENSTLDFVKANNLSSSIIKKKEDTLDNLSGTQRKSAEEIEKQTEASKEFLSVQSEGPDIIDKATQSIKEQGDAALEAGERILQLGRNFALFIQQQAAGDQDIQFAFSVPEIREGIEAEFGGFANFVEVAIGDPEEARARVQQVLRIIAAAQLESREFGGILGVDQDFAKAAEIINAFLDGLDPRSIVQATEAIKFLSGGLDEAAEAADIADGKIQILLNNLFGAENAAKKSTDAVREFFGEINDGADAADITSKSLQDMVAAIAGDQFRTPRERIADLNVILGELEERGLGNSQVAQILRATMIELSVAANVLDNNFNPLSGTFLSTDAAVRQLTEGMLPLAGIVEALTGVPLELDKVASSAAGAAKEVKTLAEEFKELLDAIFAPVNAAQAQAKAIADLGASYAELGRDAFFASRDVQTAISAITEAAESPEQAIANLQALFRFLARTVGSETDPSLQFLRQTIQRLAADFGIAADQVSQFANIDLGFFERGVRSVRKEVRTLLDFSRDLNQVITRAFDIRFASILQIDRIADAWQNLRDRVEEATRSLEELRESQQDLSADRALKEYFLSVAEGFDDSIRAAQLRKELVQLDREEARRARDLRQAELIVGGDLVVDEDVSRQSRAILLDLVSQYQNYITVLAASGASQDELREATEKARREFIQQATELGFQREVVLEYAKAFDDVRTAIDKVPRNITVDANVNPALQALNELNAKLNESINLAKELNRLTGAGSSTTTRAPSNTGGTTTPATSAEANNFRAARNAYRQQVQALQRQINAHNTDRALFNRLGRSAEWQNTANRLQAQLRAAQTSLASVEASMRRAGVGFAQGGFTGRGGKFDPAGIVHKGEFVVPKQFVNQSTGMPSPSFLAQLQNGMRGFAMGGFVGTAAPAGSSDVLMVELSPFDRQLLQQAGNVQLRVDGRVLAETNNRNNVIASQRGSN